jgi:hypothetical protein
MSLLLFEQDKYGCIFVADALAITTASQPSSIVNKVEEEPA